MGWLNQGWGEHRISNSTVFRHFKLLRLCQILNMLCNVCFRMLRGQEGRIWKGTYDLHFTHHSAGKELRRSALINCGICRVLFEELQTKVDHTLVFDDLELLVTASLSVLDHPRVQHLYRLDFKLRCNRIRSQRTFVLKRTGQ